MLNVCFHIRNTYGVGIHLKLCILYNIWKSCKAHNLSQVKWKENSWYFVTMYATIIEIIGIYEQEVMVFNKLQMPTVDWAITIHLAKMTLFNLTNTLLHTNCKNRFTRFNNIKKTAWRKETPHALLLHHRSKELSKYFQSDNEWIG